MRENDGSGVQISFAVVLLCLCVSLYSGSTHNLMLILDSKCLYLSVCVYVCFISGVCSCVQTGRLQDCVFAISWEPEEPTSEGSISVKSPRPHRHTRTRLCVCKLCWLQEAIMVACFRSSGGYSQGECGCPVQLSRAKLKRTQQSRKLQNTENSIQQNRKSYNRPGYWRIHRESRTSNIQIKEITSKQN